MELRTPIVRSGTNSLDTVVTTVLLLGEWDIFMAGVRFLRENMDKLWQGIFGVWETVIC